MKKKEGLLKSTMNNVLLSLGMKDKIETNLKATLKDGKVILFDSDELAVGSVVFMEAEEGRADIADGDYILEDGRTMTVKEGSVSGITELKADVEEVKEEAKPEEKEDVQMALVQKVIELTNEKADDKVKAIKEAVAAELAKIPVVTPMKAPKQEAVVLSKQDIKRMSVSDRARHIVLSGIREKGQPSNVNLATTTSITTTYAGQFATPYIGAALLSGETLANNAITIKQNVGLAGVTVKSLGTIGAMADATCDFTPTGNVTLTERKLTPKDLQINLQLCKSDFLLDWEAETMGVGRNGKSLPPNFQSYLLMRVAEEVAAEVETAVWQGADAAGEFEGIEAKLTTTTNLTGGAATASNIKDKLRIVTAAIPTTLKFNRDMKLYCAADIIQAFVELQGDNGIYREYQTANVPLAFDGYELIYAPGMTAGSVIAARPSNLWFGTDLISDHSVARVLDQENIDGSNNVNVVMKFTAGTQVGVVADCVHGIQAA